MRANKTTVLTLAEKCKSILASNWQGNLNTIKADAKGSKEGIHTSKVKYFVKRGKAYIWVPEKDLHNMNTIIDERGSFAVTSPYPGPLGKLLTSIKKLPARVALSGDVLPLGDEKAELAAESLRDTILSERKATKESAYSVSGILSSANLGSTSRSENLQDLLDGNEQYTIYKFNMRETWHKFQVLKEIEASELECALMARNGSYIAENSYMYIDGDGSTHEVELENIEASKADPLSPFSASLIDGINQSDVRRRALVLFCITRLNRHAKDAFMLSIDRKGFDVLGMVLGPAKADGSREYQWKDFRFPFIEEARDVDTFCQRLVEMEEEALKKIKTFSGLG